MTDRNEIIKATQPKIKRKTKTYESSTNSSSQQQNSLNLTNLRKANTIDDPSLTIDESKSKPYRMMDINELDE